MSRSLEVVEHPNDGRITKAARELAMRGGAWTQEERAALLTYCESDVVALAQLLPRILPRIDLPRALVRGRYMKAAARMEDCGVPIDLGVLAGLTAHWPEIQVRLVMEQRPEPQGSLNRDIGVLPLSPGSSGRAGVPGVDGGGVEPDRDVPPSAQRLLVDRPVPHPVLGLVLRRHLWPELPGC